MSAWQQYDNDDESRSREGVCGFVVLVELRLRLERAAKQKNGDVERCSEKTAAIAEEQIENIDAMGFYADFRKSAHQKSQQCLHPKLSYNWLGGEPNAMKASISMQPL